MDVFVSIQQLVLSVLLGLLIGLEREKQKEAEHDMTFGGVRTFPLIALMGALSTILGQNYGGPVFIILGFSAITLLILASHIYYSFVLKHSGVTSEISAVLTYLVGVSAVLLPHLMAISLTILIALFLSMKKQLHKLSHAVWEDEIYAVLKFLIITFMVLPFLPNKTIDPWHFFNPYKTWWYAVLISGISFGGYIAVKIIGTKWGLASTGFIGGITSSTSVCSIFAKRAKENPKLHLEYRDGALLSYISSIIKVGFEILLINQVLFSYAVRPLATLVITGFILFGLSLKWSKKRREGANHIELKNPFTLMFGIKFAALLTVVFALADMAQKQFGEAGIYMISFLSGLAKIDAITLKMADAAGQTVDYTVAMHAIMIGVFFSAASKCLYSYIFGGKEYFKKVAPYLLITGLAGLVAGFLM